MENLELVVRKKLDKYPSNRLPREIGGKWFYITLGGTLSKTFDTQEQAMKSLKIHLTSSNKYRN